jgi:hypothetical protein
MAWYFSSSAESRAVFFESTCGVFNLTWIAGSWGGKVETLLSAAIDDTAVEIKVTVAISFVGSFFMGVEMGVLWWKMILTGLMREWRKGRAVFIPGELFLAERRFDLIRVGGDEEGEKKKNDEGGDHGR